MSLEDYGIKNLDIRKMMINQDFGRYSEYILNDTLTTDKPIF